MLSFLLIITTIWLIIFLFDSGVQFSSCKGSVFLLLLFLAFLYFHPVEEVLLCDENMKCFVAREYPLGFRYTKSLSIDTNSELIGKIFYSPINIENANGNYFLRIYIKNTKQKFKNLFIFSTQIFGDKTLAIQTLNSTAEDYKKYISGDNKTFRLESEATELSLFVGLIIILIALFKLSVHVP